jgi:hypothetical protein
MRVAASLLLALLAPLGCSLLVDGDIDEVKCSAEGSIGAPACDVGEICAEGRCRDCLSTDVCGDLIDNDCSGQVDQDCPDDSGQAGSG